MLKKACKKGYNCGKSCISYKKACRVEFPDGVSVSLSEGRGIIQDLGIPTSPKYSTSEILKGRKIAEGSYGEVYVDSSDSSVVHKVFPAWMEERDVTGGDATLEAEIEISKRVGDLGIGPKILDVDLTPGSERISMERIFGDTLSQWSYDIDDINSSGTGEDGYRLGFEKSINAMRKFHEADVTHNDFHGGNILVQEDGSVKVIDWGRAKITNSYKDKLIDIKKSLTYSNYRPPSDRLDLNGVVRDPENLGERLNNYFRSDRKSYSKLSEQESETKYKGVLEILDDD